MLKEGVSVRPNQFHLNSLKGIHMINKTKIDSTEDLTQAQKSGQRNPMESNVEILD